MEREDFKRLYKDVVFDFISYYKYMFTYSYIGTEPKTNRAVIVVVNIGGDSADIYRADMKVSMTWDSLWHEAGSEFTNVTIRTTNIKDVDRIEFDTED